MAGNPNWKKGVSGNPGGRPKGAQFYLELLRETSTEKFVEVLKARAEAGESWAVTLGVHYCLGKPSEAKSGLEQFSDEELRAEVQRRNQDELDRHARAAQPAETSPTPH